MKPLVDQLVLAIEKSGMTRYEIAKGSGVAQSQLSRLVHGEIRMSVGNIERVGEFLGLEVVLRAKGGRRKR